MRKMVDNNVIDNDDDGDDGFQVKGRKKQDIGSSPASVRVYVGGIPIRETLQQELRSWLEQNLPQHHITIGAIEIKQGGGGQKQSSCFALIECGKHTNEVIRTLMGSSFEGHKLTVQREQRMGKMNTNSNQKKPFQQRGGGSGRGNGGRGGGGRNGSNFTTMSFSKKGWSRPSESILATTTVPIDLDDDEGIENVVPPSTLDETSSKLAGMVSSEIEQAGDDVDDLINSALASTAAVSFLASVLAGTTTEDVEDGDANNNNNKHLSYGNGSSMEEPIKIEAATREPVTITDEITSFASFVKGQSMSALLAEFGEEDPEWKKVEAPLPPPEEDGDDDEEEEHQQQVVDSSSTPVDDEDSTTAQQQPSEQEKFISRLAPHGKAPIHICIESFGYVHGAPSRQSQDYSWSPYTQPIAPIDCRSLFDPPPSYLDFHDGLRSGQVKRVLIQQSRYGSTGEGSSSSSDKRRSNERKDSSSIQNNKNNITDHPDYRDIQDYSKRILGRKEIWDALLEAQNVGQHGYVSPLNMKILVGSHLGRHRSVLIVEWAAIELRNMLRKNRNNAIHQPVSVGTLHRDIEKRIPTRKYREDADDDDRVQ
jgi:hypothetical protein